MKKFRIIVLIIFEIIIISSSIIFYSTFFQSFIYENKTSINLVLSKIGLTVK
ncbi:hypothetical protein KA977_05520 [Candidatus Dependentiae bacterium]|nr:hypothetical protein [Candidatus Dependentiae bacterium]